MINNLSLIIFLSSLSDHFLLGLAGRSYSSPSEEAHRRQTWLNNRKLVLVHNILADEGIKSYRLGMNYFADMVCMENRTLLFLPSISF